ncbi:TonB-dependent receptor [Aestuariibaculum lutulentum]|uniref:TonB-dependent receptor n=1 Tax=Aestuariibaculum lutulentum TaxID=2920935 RepID=A0ABS9RHD3_9FLAO|nr:TonB-dependent receptor [Aestuariibaculum lutulentum]MCH4552350.1 TonB-dependent receptor [Aestuariibaculum lutulentum]
MRSVFLFICLCSIGALAQDRVFGVVNDDATHLPLENVTVFNIKTGKWDVTDKEGKFTIEVDINDFEIELKILGKKTKVLTSKETAVNTSLVIVLKDEDLRLEEVEVTAVPRRSKVGSAVVLDEYAINQIQSYSLSDVLNQIPGQTITPPSLNSVNSISLRTAQESQTNAFGVSYVLDGMQLSNDENMQNYNSNSGLTTYDNVNSGIDLRSIPASNIDEIEVVTGIPDAQYGNLTSGLIKINRKAGVTPYRLSANIRQGNSAVSIGKGFKINDKLGNLSLSLDYVNANADPRNSLEQYNRLTASGIWSLYNSNKTIKNTFSLTLHNNLDDLNYDQDNDDGGQEAKYKKDRGIKLSNRFTWQPEASFIDHLNVNLGYAYTYQHSYVQSFKNDGGRVVPTGLETGLYSGEYTPVAYMQIRQVYGQPVNLNLGTSVDKTIKNSHVRHNLSLGANYSFSDNNGKGKAYDPANAHTQVTLSSGSSTLSSGEGIRALDFGRYVKPRINFGVYAQDNITWKLSNDNEVYANLGMRYDIQNGFSNFSPRINLGVELSQSLSLRGGLGFASKTPSLSQIFPGDKYFDMLIRDFRTSDYSFNLIQTYKTEIAKQNLEPTKSWKYELGLNYNTGFGNLSLTGYYNHTFDALASYNALERVDFPEVEFTFADSQSPPTYEVVGYSPLLLDYSLQTNAASTIDKGIEFYFNFNKIKAINTSFSLVGTYVYSKSFSDLDRVIQNTDPLEEQYLYGVYKSTPTKDDLFRLRGTVTHHLSDLGLLISLTAEQFTRSKSFATSSSIFPIAYINSNGERVSIPENQQESDQYSSLWLNPSSAEDKTTPIYHNFHLRMTKELLNGISMSVYANNFLDYRPVITVDGIEYVKNSPISFGAQIQYKF